MVVVGRRWKIRSFMPYVKNRPHQTVSLQNAGTEKKQGSSDDSKDFQSKNINHTAVSREASQAENMLCFF